MGDRATNSSPTSPSASKRPLLEPVDDADHSEDPEVSTPALTEDGAEVETTANAADAADAADTADASGTEEAKEPVEDGRGDGLANDGEVVHHQPEEDAPEEPPHPVQIIRINEAGDAFHLDEEKLRSVLDKAPPRMKVAVVSVVGAFRTGKSFLLDFLLRYLNASNGRDLGDLDWMNEGPAKLGGSKNVEKSSSGFSWRTGRERETTGIWMWSTPFIRQLGNSQEDVAVFLIDTQGMFDSSTSQMLTACIFGLSTLLSSYQIYNVAERVQEDNLQHLALFSEYGRIGGAQHMESNSEDFATSDGDDDLKKKPDSDVDVGAGVSVGAAAGAGGGSGGGGRAGDGIGDSAASTDKTPPFQRLEFLVRDAALKVTEDFDAMTASMEAHLAVVLSQTHLEDLKHTREQISSCFDTVSMFELPHPGFAVSEETDYDGSISQIRDRFRIMLKYYIETLFNDKLRCKLVCGREITAPELARFVTSYCKLFQNSSSFPAAKDLLSATADANNSNAKDAAYANYKEEMDTMAGIGKSFVPDSQLRHHHQACREAALAKYMSMANFGPSSARQLCREKLISDIDSEAAEYFDRNKQRDPFKDVEFYAFPMAIGLAAYVLRVISDWTCGPFTDVCRQASHLFVFVYSAMFLLALLFIVTRGHQFFSRLKVIFDLILPAKQKRD